MTAPTAEGMPMTAQSDALGLLASARAVYGEDAEALATIDTLERRLREPLRIAVAGIVKAGKSTLLNAMLGEQIAPTDAGECTRVVTWYRYADTPSITVHPHDGEPYALPVRRDNGRLVLDLDDARAEQIQRIDVGWPSRVLRTVTLIDTPGIASLSRHVSERSVQFLVPEDAPSSADAIVYLMRHLHASDMKFLESFRDTAAGRSKTINAVAVLSRADEIGSGRIDSMLSARRVATRYAADGELSALALGVIPVAGLLAEGGRTLREDEYAALRALSELERADREKLLVSADRFVNTPDAAGLSSQRRRRLLDRFGIFGVRVATSLVRGGARDSSELAAQLVQQSGLVGLADVIRLQFRSRAAALKVRSVLDVLAQLLREHPREDAAPIEAGVERIQATAHALRELSLLSRLRTSRVPLPDKESTAAERIVGGEGTTAPVRLGLREDATDEDLRAEAERQLGHWRALSQSPLLERASVEICRTVMRSLEQVVAEVAVAEVAVSEVVSRPGPADAAHVVSAGGPGEGAGEGAHKQREQDEPALDDQPRP